MRKSSILIRGSRHPQALAAVSPVLFWLVGCATIGNFDDFSGRSPSGGRSNALGGSESSGGADGLANSGGTANPATVKTTLGGGGVVVQSG